MKKRRLAAIMMAGVMALSMIPGFGVAAASPIEPSTIKLKKSLRMDSAIDNPPVSNFVFEFEEVTGDAPVLDDITISYEGNENPTETKPEMNQNVSVSVDYYNQESTLKFNSQDLVADNFPHAGLYEYTVKESATGSNYTSVANSTGLTDSMKYSKAEYTLKILVANNNTDGTLYIAQVGYTKTKDDAGQPVTAGGKSTEMVFVNEYEKDSDNGGGGDPDDNNTSLSVKKVIAGEYADMSKMFDFEITLYPNATTDATTCEGIIYREDGSKDNVAVTYGQKKTFQLGHNDELRFSYLPVGAKYNVTETTAANYTATVSGVVEGNTISNQPLNQFVKDYTAGDNKDDKITVTNTYRETPQTGIATDVLPFVILMVVAVVGMIVYAAVRRRFHA